MHAGVVGRFPVDWSCFLRVYTQSRCSHPWTRHDTVYDTFIQCKITLLVSIHPLHTSYVLNSLLIVVKNAFEEIGDVGTMGRRIERHCQMVEHE